MQYGNLLECAASQAMRHGSLIFLNTYLTEQRANIQFHTRRLTPWVVTLRVPHAEAQRTPAGSPHESRPFFLPNNLWPDELASETNSRRGEKSASKSSVRGNGRTCSGDRRIGARMLTMSEPDIMAPLPKAGQGRK